MALQKNRCTNAKCFYYFHDIKVPITNNQCPLCKADTEKKMYWGENRKISYDIDESLISIFINQAFGTLSKDDEVAADVLNTLIDEGREKDIPVTLRKLLAIRLVQNHKFEEAYYIFKPILSDMNEKSLQDLENDRSIELIEFSLVSLNKMEELSSLEDQMIPYCQRKYGENDPVTLEHVSLKFLSIAKKLTSIMISK